MDTGTSFTKTSTFSAERLFLILAVAPVSGRKHLIQSISHANAEDKVF